MDLVDMGRYKRMYYISVLQKFFILSPRYQYNIWKPKQIDSINFRCK